MKKSIKFKIGKITSKIGYVLLLLFYLVMGQLARKTSMSDEMFSLFGHNFPVNILAGVFSSMVAVTLISLTLFYRRLGFYTAIGILCYRYVSLTIGLLNLRLGCLPGLTVTIGTTLSVVVIYKRTENLLKSEEKRRNDIWDFTNSIIDSFSICIDGKDSYTNGHSLRVARYTKMLALKLGEDAETADRYYNIALLHDIGKIGIPDEILNKPGKLTESEYETVKEHAYRGYEILKKVKRQAFLAEGARYHHERFDGAGYPSNLKGDKIPWVARIISVADAFDAMSSTRPYRKRFPMEKIVKEIKDCSGTQFDPVVTKAFLDLYEEGAFADVVFSE